MPRLIRRRPLLERIQEYLNPYDFLIWVSEEIESREWDDKNVANQIGAALNFVFLVARANSGGGRSRAVDDVFGEGGSGGMGWFGWLSAFTVYILTTLSVTNAAYTFLRRRHYRLFELATEVAPGTPNASRVRVDNTPTSPDPIREVWEVRVWDPLPLCLRLYSLFSPGHVLVYWLFLPAAPLDPRPSITVVTTILLVALMSAQLVVLEHSFAQQAKDTAVIQKQVLNEYDTKYVHPRLHPSVRDVGTQFVHDSLDSTKPANDEVVTYTPTTILRRGWQTNPNPSYAGLLPQSTPLTATEGGVGGGPFQTPIAQSSRRESTPPFRPSMAPSSSVITQRQPHLRQSFGPSLGSGLAASSSTNITSRDSSSGGDGGSLGIYTHANSPLKKASSMYDMGNRLDPPRNSFQAAQREILEERERKLRAVRERERSRSPVKRLQESGKEVRRSLPLGEGYKVVEKGKPRSYY